MSVNWERNISGRQKRKHKGSVVAICSAYLRDNKEVNVAAKVREKGRVGTNEVRAEAREN